MKYSKRERKEIAKAFHEAKKHLWDGTGTRTNEYCVHICSSLHDVAYSPPYLRTSAETARYIITDRLYPYPTVEAFLFCKYQVSEFSSSSVKTQIQQYRHAWLDALIKEFSS